jgi:ATP-dependent 26S proteasome regulatory subunit
MSIFTITVHQSKQTGWVSLFDEEIISQNDHNQTLSFDSDTFRSWFLTLEKLNKPSFFQSIDHFTWRGEKTNSDFISRKLTHLHHLNEELKQNDESSPDGWGYPQLNAVKKEIPRTQQEAEHGVYWYQFGKFKTDHLWEINKQRIQAILQQEAEDQLLHLCPEFHFSRVLKTIERLPDFIDLNKNTNWKIRYEHLVDGNRIQQKPTGIIHKITLGQDLEGMLQKGQSGKEADADAEEQTRRIPNVSFDEIGGIDPILQKIREVIELPLKNPGMFSYMGIEPHRGILLYGPPGCGKTMIAKAVANEIEAHFISVKGPELLNKYYGQSEENLRNLFEEASRLQPSIIFFDEIDSIAQRRSGADNLRIEAKFVNQLLTMMDGIDDYGNISVIAATNRPELIDEALLRRGRFDYQLEVPKPDKDGLNQIFSIHTRNKPLDESISTGEILTELQGATGSDVAYTVREAAFNCLRRNLTLNKDTLGETIEEKTYESFTISEADILTALKDFSGEKTDS